MRCMEPKPLCKYLPLLYCTVLKGCVNSHFSSICQSKNPNPMAAPSPLCLCLSSPFFPPPPPPPPATISSTSIRFPIRRCQLSLLSVRAAVSAKDTPAPRQPRGIMKPTPITPELQVIVGVPEISRTQALKLVWAYIKQHDLQDPNNKKIILCDEKLKKIFGKEQVGLLEVTKLLNPHFKKKE